MERFHNEDQREFRTVREMRDVLDEWLTSPPVAGVGDGYVESGSGDDLKRMTLFRERLSDGSFVYGVRLS